MFSFQFQYLAVADNIAAELGNKPDWWHFLLQGDVKMALALLFGPAHPFHYRLCGPHKWGGARDATFNAYRETIYSTQHRRVWEEEEKNKRREWLQVLKPLWLFVLGLVVYLIWSQLRVWLRQAKRSATSPSGEGVGVFICCLKFGNIYNL